MLQAATPVIAELAGCPKCTLLVCIIARASDHVDCIKWSKLNMHIA